MTWWITLYCTTRYARVHSRHTDSKTTFSLAHAILLSTARAAANCTFILRVVAARPGSFLIAMQSTFFSKRVHESRFGNRRRESQHPLRGTEIVCFVLTQWCKFLKQEVREKRRRFCCAAALVSPLPPATFRCEFQIFNPKIVTPG